MAKWWTSHLFVDYAIVYFFIFVSLSVWVWHGGEQEKQTHIFLYFFDLFYCMIGGFSNLLLYLLYFGKKIVMSYMYFFQNQLKIYYHSPN